MGKGRHVSERHLSALRFDRILTVRTSGVDRNWPDDVLVLLALRFYASDAPGGTVEFIFSGNAALRLEMECIEAQLTDIGPVWQVDVCPRHE